jgi:hypothetical protein
METAPFTATRLPRFRPGTDGYALPKPGQPVVACLMPETRALPRPPSWGEGEALTGVAGKHWHVVQDLAAGDHYPNDEFAVFYTLGRRFMPGEDLRGDFLFETWRGHEIEVFEATKTRPALVLGVCDEAGQIETAEGTVGFEPGDVILLSPEDASRVWPVKQRVFAKKYQGTQCGRPE